MNQGQRNLVEKVQGWQEREACGEWEREEQETGWAGGASFGKGEDSNEVGHSIDRQSWGEDPGRNLRGGMGKVPRAGSGWRLRCRRLLTGPKGLACQGEGFGNYPAGMDSFAILVLCDPAHGHGCLKEEWTPDPSWANEHLCPRK